MFAPRDFFGYRAFCGIHVSVHPDLRFAYDLPQRSYSVFSSARNAASDIGCTSRA